MDLFDGIELPDTAAMHAVRSYLQAQADQDFSKASEFFTDDVIFQGIVLKAKGRAEVAAQVEGFIKSAVKYIQMEYITQLDDDRVLALYWFKLKPAAEPQALCDHIVVKDGKIAKVENVFDVRKLPPM